MVKDMMRTPLKATCLAAALLSGAASLAEAQNAMPPKGCEAFLTMHTRNCAVSIFWRCGAQPGLLFEGSHDDDGPVSLHTYDDEFQWIDAYYYWTDSREKLLNPGPDPISMTELLETGVDTYNFSMISEGDGDTGKLFTTGRDEALGETVVIDGVELDLFSTSSVTKDADGNTVFAAEGVQYVLKSERLFMLGKESYFDGQERWKEDNTPVEFMFPGEKGFGKTEPRHGCNALQAGLSLPMQRQ